MTKGPIDKFHRAAAHRLRMNATDAEARLWRRLRRFPIAGTHFRRQVPIGPYVADFACMAARLIIEVNGSQHGDEINRARDEVRTRWFASKGYRVLRVWNNDVSSRNIEGVLEAIYAAVHGSRDAEPVRLKHARRRRLNAGHPTPPASPSLRSASAVDPPLPGEGGTSGKSARG